jgi:hypothetical protein
MAFLTTRVDAFTFLRAIVDCDNRACVFVQVGEDVHVKSMSGLRDEIRTQMAYFTRHGELPANPLPIHCISADMYGGVVDLTVGVRESHPGELMLRFNLGKNYQSVWFLPNGDLKFEHLVDPCKNLNHIGSLFAYVWTKVRLTLYVDDLAAQEFLFSRLASEFPFVRTPIFQRTALPVVERQALNLEQAFFGMAEASAMDDDLETDDAIMQAKRVRDEKVACLQRMMADADRDFETAKARFNRL